MVKFYENRTRNDFGRIFGKKRALYNIIYRKKDIIMSFVHKYKKRVYGTILYVMFHFTQFV